MKKALQEIVRNTPDLASNASRSAESTSSAIGRDVLKAVLQRGYQHHLQATLDERSITRQTLIQCSRYDPLRAKHIYIIGMRTSTTLADFLGISISSNAAG